MILESSLIVCLIWMFYQDMRYRAIYWLSFPLLALFLTAFLYKSPGKEQILDNTVLNLSMLAVQMLFVSFWFSLKNKRLTNITKDYLGWGDVLFLLAITVYFSPGNYFLFYVCSLLGVLMVSVKSILKAGSQAKIPLAGLQALFFAVILVMSWTKVIPDLTNDSWIIDRFGK